MRGREGAVEIEGVGRGVDDEKDGGVQVDGQRGILQKRGRILI